MPQIGGLNELAKLQGILERARISANNQNLHIEDETPIGRLYERVAETLEGLETEAETIMHEEVKQHPAWPWLSTIRGVGPQTASIVLAYLLPPIPEKGPSSWYKAAGLYVIEAADGSHRLPRAQHLQEGEKISWHPRLRRNLWVLSESLIKASGFYYHFYRDVKETLQIKHPDWKGRCHAVARWKMVKLLLSHLYEMWAEAIGVPVRGAYPIEILGHTDIIRPPIADGAKV